MQQLSPIFLADLLPRLDKQLIELLKGLSIDDWMAPTTASQWCVKDIAVHLLDGNLRALSMLRDGYYGESADGVNSYPEMVQYLNRLNADWVQAMKRLSPAVIIDLLTISGKEYCEYIKRLNPFEPATFSVGWAGEEESLNWFHIAREYTEKWHHQQQIRHAVGRDYTLMSHLYFAPYLDTSVRALPYHYRELTGNKGDLIRFVFKGEREYIYYLKWGDNRWDLGAEPEGEISTEVIIPADIIWRVFTKGIARDSAIELSTFAGSRDQGLKIFDLIAVMA